MSATVRACAPLRVLAMAPPACTGAFADDPHVEAGTVVADQQRGHLRDTEPQADPVAGHPRLGDLELGLTDPVPVPDAHLVIRQALNGEVLPKLAVAEITPAQVLRPVPVGADLNGHGPLLTAVAVQVALAVTTRLMPRYAAARPSG